VEYGKPLGVLPTPSREGYAFEGWYAEAAGNSAIDPYLPVEASRTIYAQWTKQYDFDSIVGGTMVKSGSSFSWNDESHQDFDPGFFLVPREILSPMDGVSITGMGWVDGFLHIQSHYADISETDAHGYVFLTDASGAQMDSFYEVSFWDADFSSSYEEQIFDISPEELAGCAFHGWFTAFDSITEGNWEITFPIE